MRMFAVGVSAARAPSGPPLRAFRHGNASLADRRRVFAKTTTKAWRAPKPSRLSLGGAARVSYTHRLSRTRVDRGGGASGAFARANAGHASRSPACFASSSDFSSSETPEPRSSSEHTHSRHAHFARRVALALAVIALVVFVAVEACGARASFPTFETLRPDGLSLPPSPRFSALLRDARTLLEKTRPSLVIALMAFLTVNPAPLRRASRETFHALARCLAARDAPNWVTAATALSGPYVGRALRLCFFWALANRLARTPCVDSGTVLAAPPILRALAATVASVFGDAGATGHGSDEFAALGVPLRVTVGETRAWFFVASARVLVAALCVLAAQWVMHAKRPPPRPAAPTETSVAEAVPPAERTGGGEKHTDDGVSDPVARHFAALRGDAGVSWDRQAKAALIDSALSCAVVAASVLSVANALRVDVTGLLAVGGFGGVAFGFAAQRCVANFISGVLIFVTQPFKQGDLVATAHAAGEGAFRGVVKQVGWHSTSLESCKDGSVLIVPNSELSTVAVRNVSRRERRAVLETVPVSLPIETTHVVDARNGGLDAQKKKFARARAAVFAANRALISHVGVEPSTGSVSDRVDGAATPRCVLTSDPATGATKITCAYVMARNVPEPWAEAVRSAVLVKLREAVAAALVVEEEEEEEEEDEEDSDSEDSDSEDSEDGDSEGGSDGAVVRELTGHYDHHFPQPRDASSERRENGERKKKSNVRDDVVARSMRRGEREYEAAAGRYRDEDDDGDACW